MPGPFLGPFLAAQTQRTLKNASSAGRLLSWVHTLHIRLLAATTESLGTEGAHLRCERRFKGDRDLSVAPALEVGLPLGVDHTG